jgi:hypothetical protein
MNDQSKSQAQKSQPTDIISSIKNKTELKETEKNNALGDEWNDYSDNEDEDTPVQNQNAVKEKENKDKNEPKKLGDILGKKQPLQQGAKKPYNKTGSEKRQNKEGGMKKFYNNNTDGNKNYEKTYDKNYDKNISNSNQNYEKRRDNKDGDKKELEKRIANVGGILANNERNNENFKATKTYDTEPSTQSNTKSDIAKPNFRNEAIKDNNLRELNVDEDLYLKNLKNRGLDKEPEREEGEENDENKKKRTYNTKKPYNTGKPYYNKPRYNNNEGGAKPEKEVDEDGFEKVVTNKPKKTYNNSYNTGKYNNDRKQPRHDNSERNEQQAWESVTEKREGEEGEENKEEGERRREERPRDENREHKWENRENNRGENRESNRGGENRGETRGEYKGENRGERRDKKGGPNQKKEATVWETEAAFTEKKEKEVEVVKQPTKVEITMKGSNLKDLFSKKK